MVKGLGASECIHTHAHPHTGSYDDALCDESGQAQKRWARAGFHGRAKIFIVWKWAFVRETRRCVYRHHCRRRLCVAAILLLSLSLLNAVKHGGTRVKTTYYIPAPGLEERERERVRQREKEREGERFSRRKFNILLLGQRNWQSASSIGRSREVDNHDNPRGSSQPSDIVRFSANFSNNKVDGNLVSND